MKYILLFLTLTGVSGLFAQNGTIHYNLNVIDQEQQPISGAKVKWVEVNSLDSGSAVTDASGNVKLILEDGQRWALSIKNLQDCKYINAVPGQVYQLQNRYVYDEERFYRMRREKPSRDSLDIEVVRVNHDQNDPFPEDKSMLIMSVVDPFTGAALPNISVTMVSLKDEKAYQTTSNADGVATFIVPSNTDYEIDVADVQDFSYCDFGPGSNVKTDYVQFVPTKIKEYEVDGYIVQKGELKPTSSRVHLQFNVLGSNSSPDTVVFEDSKSGKKFRATTDFGGRGEVILPINTIYMVHVNDKNGVDALNFNHINELTTWTANFYVYPPPAEVPNWEVQYDLYALMDSLHFHDTDYRAFFDAQYEKPEKGGIRLVFEQVFNLDKTSREAVFQVRIATTEKSEVDPLPMNVAMVIDKSGSMYEDERYLYLKNAVAQTKDKFSDNDYLSLITFNSEAYNLGTVSEEHSEFIDWFIKYYRPGGGTSITDGLKEGLSSCDKEFRDEYLNKVILLSDGYGFDLPEEIEKMLRPYTKKGIQVSTVGIGNDVNTALLDLIATNGDGAFYRIYSPEDLLTTVDEDIEAALYPAIYDLKIDIEFNEAMRYEKLYGYDLDTSGEGFVGFEVPYFSAELSDIAYLKFKLDAAKAMELDQPVKMHVSYFDRRLDKTVEYTEEMELQWREKGELELLVDKTEKELFVIADINQGIKQITDYYLGQTHINPEDVFKRCKSQIKEHFPDASRKEIKQLMAQLEALDKFLEEHSTEE